MGFRVDKGDNNFISRYKSHRKTLATRQHLERIEEARRKTLNQAEERDRRASSRAPQEVGSKRKRLLGETPMEDIEGEETQIREQEDNIDLERSSSSQEEALITKIKFKKLPSNARASIGPDLSGIIRGDTCKLHSLIVIPSFPKKKKNKKKHEERGETPSLAFLLGKGSQNVLCQSSIERCKGGLRVYT